MGLLTPLIKTVARELTESVARNTPESIGKSIASEIPIHQPGSYSGNPLARAGAFTLGGIKGVGQAAIREFSPLHLKEQKLFREEGVPMRLQNVLKEELGTIDSVEATRLRAKYEDHRQQSRKGAELRKRITAETDKGENKDTQLIKSLAKELSKNNKLVKQKKFTAKEEKDFKRLGETGKIIEGQKDYTNMLNTQYGQNTVKELDAAFDENFYGKGKLTIEDFTSGLNQYKPWDIQEGLTPERTDTLFRRVTEAWGVDKEAPHTVDLYIKKPVGDSASGDLIKGMNFGTIRTKDKTINLLGDKIANLPGIGKFTQKELKASTWNVNEVLKLFRQRGKAFDNLDDLAKEMKKAGIATEKVDDALFFSDSFKSSSYVLGGVNQQSFVTKEGDMFSLVSDKLDLGPVPMPGGNQGVTMTPLYAHKNPIKTKSKEAKKEIAKKEKAWTKETKAAKERTNKKLFGTTTEPEMELYKSGLSARQRKIAEDIVDMRTSKLSTEDYLRYLAKMGILGGGLKGLLSQGDDK